MNEIQNFICQHNHKKIVAYQVHICLDCSTLFLQSQMTKQTITFVKPLKYNKKTVNNPLIIFKTITESITEQNGNQLTFSDLYKTVRIQQIDFLKQICSKTRVSNQCFHLSICYLDIVLSEKTALSYYKCDVITASCFILALKFTEMDPVIPYYTSFSTSNGKNFLKAEDIKKAEIKSLKKLQYKLDRVTSHDVLDILFLGGIISSDEITSKPDEFMRNVYAYTSKLLYKVVCNNVINEYYNSVQIAFSVVYIARKIHGLNVFFRKNLKHIYDIQFESYKECVKDISKYVLNQNTQEQSDVYIHTEKAPTSPSPRKTRQYEEETPFKTARLKHRSVQFSERLPQVPFSALQTESSTAMSTYSGVKQSSTSLFKQKLGLMSRSVLGKPIVPKSSTNLNEYYMLQDQMSSAKKKKTISMFRPLYKNMQEVILPKI